MRVLVDGSCCSLPACCSRPAPAPPSRLLHELGLEAHGADAVYFAVDVVIAADKSDVLHLRAHLDDLG